MNRIKLLFNLWLAAKLILIPVNVFSENYYSMANGKWSNSETWFCTSSPHKTLNAKDTVIINHHLILDQELKNFGATLIIKPKASLNSKENSIRLTHNGKILNNGTISLYHLILTQGATYNGKGTLITEKDLFINGYIVFHADGPCRIGRNLIINYQNKSLVCDAEVVFNHFLEVKNDIAAGYLSNNEFNGKTVINGSIISLQGTTCFSGDILVKGSENVINYSDYIYISGKINFANDISLVNSKVYISGQFTSDKDIIVSGKITEIRNFGIVSSKNHFIFNQGIMYNFGTLTDNLIIASNAHLVDNKLYQQNYLNTVKDKNTVQSTEK